MNPRISTRSRLSTAPFAARQSVPAWLFLVFAAPATTTQAPKPEYPGKSAKISIHPDVRVSYDGDVVHMEACVAASALDLLFVAKGEGPNRYVGDNLRMAGFCDAWRRQAEAPKGQDQL